MARNPRISTVDRLSNNVKSFVRSIGTWPVFVRMIATYIFASLAGSPFVSIVNTFAVYNYAWMNGARVPVEGVPYLTLALSLMYLFAAFVTFLTWVTVYVGLAVLAFGVRRFHNFVAVRVLKYFRVRDRLREIKEGVEKREVSPEEALEGLDRLDRIVDEARRITSKAPVVVIAVLLAVLRHQIVPEAYHTVYLFFAVWPVAILIVWLAEKYEKVKFLAIPASLLAVLIVMARMYDVSVYSQMLHMLRQGGNIPVMVCALESDRKVCYDSRLFLVTSDVYMLYDQGKDVYLEVPLKDVVSVEYPRSPSVYDGGELLRDYRFFSPPFSFSR